MCFNMIEQTTNSARFSQVQSHEEQCDPNLEDGSMFSKSEEVSSYPLDGWIDRERRGSRLANRVG